MAEKSKKIQFGNWIVDLGDRQIYWHDETWCVPFKNLHDKREVRNGNVYNWMVHVAENRRRETEDVLNFNSAMQYVFVKFGMGYDKNISWVESLKEQKKHYSQPRSKNDPKTIGMRYGE